MHKRLFDILFSLFLLLFFLWILIIAWIISVLDTQTNGVFIQERIGRYGIKFKIYKLRTITISTQSMVISASKTGRFFRKYKLDELPQLLNVLRGDMSIVGPRPDIPGYYDLLKGENRKILDLKPGLTSFAAIKYFNEEYLLLVNENSQKFNDDVIFPDKVRLNLEYYYSHTFYGDLKIIWKTIFQKQE